MRKITALLLTAFSLSTQAAPPSTKIKLTAEKLRFNHRPAETAEFLTCRHRLADELAQDWDVECLDGEKVARRYRVHLWLSAYTHPQEPKLSYELLYWVDDRTQPAVQSLGTTVWFHLKDPSALQALSVSQFVDNGIADLHLSIAL